MNTILRWLTIFGIVLASSAANTNSTADRVIGQQDFTHNTANHGGVNPSASDLHDPAGAALDAAGNLYVADTANNRVLEYDAPLSSGKAASRVFGQPDFTQYAPNNGGVRATSLFVPDALALDKQGNLYVADGLNNRVLEYDAPLISTMAASRVFGQPDFTHNDRGLSANGLSLPEGVTLDQQGNLYVGDTVNNRVLEYDAPLASGMAASRVFGQPTFITNTSNNGGLSAKSLDIPAGVVLDALGNLYVADTGNSRVLVYSAPLTSTMVASRVIGQPTFITNTSNNGGLSANSLSAPTSVALDAQGNLYVGDQLNNRVLEYDAPLTTDRTADHVFGQPDFGSGFPNINGVSANSLNIPTGAALDARGNLYVADTGNHRVLVYDAFRFILPLVMH
jgi:sugar lactone lactonase YvrE